MKERPENSESNDNKHCGFPTGALTLKNEGRKESMIRRERRAKARLRAECQRQQNLPQSGRINCAQSNGPVSETSAHQSPCLANQTGQGSELRNQLGRQKEQREDEGVKKKRMDEVNSPTFGWTLSAKHAYRANKS